MTTSSTVIPPNPASEVCNEDVVGFFFRYLLCRCNFVYYFVLLMSFERGHLHGSSCPCPPVSVRATEGWTRRWTIF